MGREGEETCVQGQHLHQKCIFSVSDQRKKTFFFSLYLSYSAGLHFYFKDLAPHSTWYLYLELCISPPPYLSADQKEVMEKNWSPYCTTAH